MNKPTDRQTTNMYVVIQIKKIAKIMIWTNGKKERHKKRLKKQIKEKDR